MTMQMYDGIYPMKMTAENKAIGVPRSSAKHSAVNTRNECHRNEIRTKVPDICHAVLYKK